MGDRSRAAASATLQVTFAQQSDAGSYTCQVTLTASEGEHIQSSTPCEVTWVPLANFVDPVGVQHTFKGQEVSLPFTIANPTISHTFTGQAIAA